VHWQNWRDRRSSEDRFVQRVLDTFGSNRKHIVIAWGQATGFHALRGLPPSLTVGMRRPFEAKKHYLEAMERLHDIRLGCLTIITTPEPYTTKTCSRCGQRSLEPSPLHKRTTKSGREVPLRGTRRCTNVSCGGLAKSGAPYLRLWDRDLNAAMNIRANLIHYHTHGQWDPRFTRTQPSAVPTRSVVATTEKSL
jgi:hypothetical protein